MGGTGTGTAVDISTSANSLAEVRWLFYKASGRADLVANISTSAKTCTNNGADYFINRGIRHLDLLQESQVSRRRAVFQITSGEYYTDLPECRSIDGVYVIDSESNRTRLEKASLEWLRSYYNTTAETVISDTPLYYAENVIQIAPQNEGDTSTTLSGMFDWQDLTLGSSAGSKGMLFLPPSDGTYTMVVYGKFFTPELLEDDDSCFWIDEYSNLVVWAACREVEISYRNSEGANDWDRAIAAELRGIDFDQAEQDSNELTSLEG